MNFQSDWNYWTWTSRKSFMIFMSLITLSLFMDLTEAQSGQYTDTRCVCTCPEPNLVIKNFTITTNRTVYIPKTAPHPSQCICEEVVLPQISDILGGKTGEFCPRCNCKYSKRNTTVIQVVVIIVIWIVSLLMIYMLFLMCLEPLLNKRIKTPAAYTEHTNEEDETVEEGESSGGGGRTSHTIRMTNTPGAAAPSVLNRVGHQQSKWKRQVQEQRRNIYDRHTMLN